MTLRLHKIVLTAFGGLGALASPFVLAPAQATVSQASPTAFVETLAGDGLAALQSGSDAQKRARFRSLLGDHFAVRQIGDRLIQRWRSRISTSQYQSYTRALPGFILGTYADRLSAYSRADVSVINQRQSGSSYLVQTRITNPGSRPVDAIWYLTRSGSQYQVYNMRVAGINLTLNQAQDFDSYIQRNSFDALIAFMERRGGS